MSDLSSAEASGRDAGRGRIDGSLAKAEEITGITHQQGRCSRHLRKKYPVEHRAAALGHACVYRQPVLRPNSRPHSTGCVRPFGEGRMITIVFRPRDGSGCTTSSSTAR